MFIQFADTTQTHVTVVEISDKSPCDILGLNGAKKFQVFSKGEILEIKKISVSNADFGEHYVIHSETALGELELASNNLAIWLDGKPVTQSDLRRTIFFLPSLLMYWPMAPVMLPTLFNK
ncbi:MAG: hypothetical protein HUU56_15860 [Bdellovibrionaceae bacterium]|nr:hypothetical protein [Pseudobdellovibrionaceae bacterium]